MQNSATLHTALSFSHARHLYLAALIAAACGLCHAAHAATPALAATEFPGQLKSVTITDAAGTNTPPTAVIEYSNDGDTYTFDASKSTDSDGSIVSYKWDFGDGNTADTVTATHQFTTTQNQITLSVTDDKNGIALAQIPLSATVLGPELIPDGTFNYKSTSENFIFGSYGPPPTAALQ
jgi:PKD repeat protein